MKISITGAALACCAALFATALCSAQPPDPVEGPALYRSYCATCHGTDGKGIGPMTQWLKIEAPDLTRIARREAGKFPLARIQRIIAGSENTTKGHGSREMPVWGPIFSQVANDQDFGKVRIYNLAKYIEKLQIR